MSTNGCQVKKPGGKLVEMVEVPSKEDPDRNILTSEQHITTAKAQDFFRGRFAGKLGITPMGYGKNIPPMKGFKELLQHWGTIEKPTHGQKTPYYAERKTRIHRKAPHLAQEIHKLMKSDPHHQQCLKI